MHNRLETVRNFSRREHIKVSKSVIDQALSLIEGQIAKRLHSVVGELPAAIQTLKELNAAAVRLEKSWDGMSEVPNEFQMGVLEVLSTLDAFRSGYAMNADQSQGTVSQQFFLPTSIAGVAKAAAEVKTEDEALKLFDEHFVAAVKSTSNVDALGTFRVLRDMLQRKDIAFGALATPASTEPDAALRTSESGSIEAEQAANTTGATNFKKAEDAPAAPASAASQTEVRWERDMAKRGVIKASAALPAASEAIEKSEEVPFAGWPMDMAPRAARR